MNHLWGLEAIHSAWVQSPMALNLCSPFTGHPTSIQGPSAWSPHDPVLGLQILKGHFAHGVRQERREGRHVQLQFLDVRVQGDLLYMV